MSKQPHELERTISLYSIATVAARLDVSQDTVRRLIGSGALTPIRIGSAVRIDASELEALISRQRAAANEISE
jgi:excisionase family DNA binding protein